jgi:ParB family chromosome partitioning protein
MNDPTPRARLGRGLSALMGEYATASQPSGDTTSTLPLDQIEPNPAQPRRHFDEAELEELTASIRQHGLIQAILVRPDAKTPGRYQIVAGERRWRAAKAAGLKDVPVVVRELNELEVLELAIIENVQRANLNAIEEAEAYEALMKRFGRTQQAVADTLGKSRVHIANTLRLLALPESVRQLLREGKLTAGHARAVLAVEEDRREAFAETLVAGNLSVRDAERLAAERPSTEPPLEIKSMPSDLGTKRTPKDVDTQALEADLSRILGLPVDIRLKAGEAGEIKVNFRTLEQLDDVCRRLSQRRS